MRWFLGRVGRQEEAVDFRSILARVEGKNNGTGGERQLGLERAPLPLSLCDACGPHCRCEDCSGSCIRARVVTRVGRDEKRVVVWRGRHDASPQAVRPRRMNVKLPRDGAASAAVVLAAGFTAAGAESEAGESSAASANTVKLGLMIAKNGQSLSSDEWEVLADIFEDVINNKHEDLSLPFASDEGLPGLGGAKVEFVTGEQIDTQTAVMVADQLIQEEGVVGLFGHFTSTTTAAAMVSAEKNSVPLLSEGTSMSLLNAGYDYWLRSFGGDDFYVQRSMEFINSVKEAYGDISTIALCSENSDFGTGIATLEKAAAEENGYTVVENVFYDSAVRAGAIAVGKTNAPAFAFRNSALHSHLSGYYAVSTHQCVCQTHVRTGHT